MEPIRVFDVIRRRRQTLFGLVAALVIISSVVLSANFFDRTKKAKAVDFVASGSQLVVPENQLLYIGGYGYPSQRLFSSIAEPINSSHQIPSSGVVIPPNHIYNSGYSSQQCWPDVKTTWGGNLQNCYLIVGDNTGMILRYTNSIDIYGTVIINDRVVFDAPNITIHSTAKIYANGQDNQLGFGDAGCGAGGVGGINGGTLAENLNSVHSYVGYNFAQCIGPNIQGGPSTNLLYPSIVATNIAALNNDVKPYFVANGTDVVGGRGSDSSGVFTGTTTAGSGAGSAVGVGGGGSSGSTGTTSSDDHASSGGGGGGFGFVFQAENLLVNSAAVITASGGNSLASADGTSQYPGHTENPTGAFGGPGGGGVIIINSPSISFRAGTNNQLEALADFAIFKVKAGIHKFPAEFNPDAIWIDGTVKSPPGGEDGKLILNPGNIVSIKKSVQNLGPSPDDPQLLPDYVFRDGDIVVITLKVSNLSPNSRVTIVDEIFSDGVNIGSVASDISDGGVSDGNKITWSILPTTTTKTLTYKLTVK